MPTSSRPRKPHNKRKQHTLAGAINAWNRVIGVKEMPKTTDLIHLDLLTRTAYEQLRCGRAVTEHMQHLSDAVNVAEALISDVMFPEAQIPQQRALDALLSIHARMKARGRIIATASELDALNTFLDYHTIIMNNVTVNEIEAACARVEAQARKPKSHTVIQWPARISEAA